MQVQACSAHVHNIEYACTGRPVLWAVRLSYQLDTVYHQTVSQIVQLKLFQTVYSNVVLLKLSSCTMFRGQKRSYHQVMS